jgi:NTP pyrophosphatase (non-canonical NTP hydrolase)
MAELQDAIRDFADRRDWHQFHTPKNLAMALCGEAGELAAELQWLTPEESQHLDVAATERLRLEMADVLIYLLRLADVVGIDVEDAVRTKLAINESRFPAASN